LSVQYPRNTGMVLRKTWADNRDTTLKQFHEMFPEWEKYYTEKTHRLPNGSVIFWRGMDRVGRVKQLLNYNLGWFWLEQMEELFEEVWNVLEGRLKLNHVKLSGFGTANPAGHNWCYNKFIAPDKIKEYHYFQPPPRWNKLNLPDKYYEEKEKSWPAEMVDRYLNGNHEGYEGLIYSNFNRLNHIARPALTPQDVAMIQRDAKNFGQFYEFQDYGISSTSPMTWYLVWRRPDGKMIILDEFYKYKCMPKEAADWVKTTRIKWDVRDRLIATYGCPRTFQKEKDGTTPAQFFYTNHGINLLPAPCLFETRYPIVYGAFENNQIIINETCTHMIAELEALTWENRGTASDHAIEPLERGLLKVLAMPVEQIDVQRANRGAAKAITANLMETDF